jgi:hypothetical protein
MTRLTHSTYSDRRECLREAWIHSQRTFFVLTAKEQWDLHNFYVVTQEMTSPELRLHRRLVKQVDPSLPQRAGRAYAKLERGDWKRIDYAVTPKGRAITIRTLVKPKPDLERYARTILAYVRRRKP